MIKKKLVRTKLHATGLRFTKEFHSLLKKHCFFNYESLTHVHLSKKKVFPTNGTVLKSNGEDIRMKKSEKRKKNCVASTFTRPVMDLDLMWNSFTKELHYWQKKRSVFSPDYLPLALDK